MSRCENKQNAIRPLVLQSAADVTEQNELKARIPEKLFSELWTHQLTSLYNAYLFEKNNAVDSEHRRAINNSGTLQGILALSPGQGKTRIALALACLNNTATKKTLIIVPNLLFSHWISESKKCGLRVFGISGNNDAVLIWPRDSCEIVIVKHSSVNRVQTLHLYHRIIYDEIDCVRTAKGRRVVQLSQEPNVKWVLNGTVEKSEYFTKERFVRYNNGVDKSLKGTLEVAYVPATHASVIKGWGNKFYPTNTIECCPTFVETSQNLRLPPPVMHNHVIRNVVHNSVAVLNDKVKQFINNQDYAGLRSFMESDSGIENVNLKHYAQIILERNESTITQLSNQMAKLQINCPPEGDNDDKKDCEADDCVREVVKQSIKQFQTQIDRLKSESALIENKCSDDSTCAICWAPAIAEDGGTHEPMAFVKCCHTQFCCVCIFTCLAEHEHCPYCRKACTADEVVHIAAKDATVVDNNTDHDDMLSTRDEVVETILREAEPKNEKIIVYGTFDSPYVDYAAQYKVGKIAMLPSQAHEAMKTISTFQQGDSSINVLLLSDKTNAKGHNFSFVSQIIVLDQKVAKDKLTQIIGRAHRPGRRDDHVLHVHTFETKQKK